MKNKIEAPMTHPSYDYFLLFCEEVLPSGMFLSGGRLDRNCSCYMDWQRSQYLELSHLRQYGSFK